MSLRLKLALAYAIVTLVTMSLAISYSGAVVTGGFEELESEMMVRNAERCEAAIQADIDALERMCRDWSAWDDSYSFVADPVSNASFVGENLLPVSLSNLRLSLLLFLNAHGELVWGYDIDPDGNPSRLSRYWPHEMVSHEHPIIAAAKERIVSGVLSVNGHLIALTSQPIVKTDLSGHPGGTLVFGRDFGEDAIAELSKRLSMPLTIGVCGDGSSEGIQKDGKRIDSTRFITDFFGQKTLLVTTTQSRDIMEKSRRANEALIVGLLLSGLALFSITWLIVDRTVIRRTLELRRYLHVIVEHPEREQVLPEMSGQDFGALALDINRSLKGLYSLRKEIERNLENMQALLDNTLEGIFTIDRDGNIVHFNLAAQRTYGYSLNEVRGKALDDLLARSDQRRRFQSVSRYSTKSVEDLRGSGREVLARRKDGSLFPAFIAISNEAIGSLQLYTGIIRDISSMKNEQERLIEDATVDPLTHLLNRKKFLSDLANVIDESVSLKLPLVLCICDLDHFKTVNDTYGHVIGDLVLERSSALILTCIRADDFAGRYGGDELCIALRQTDPDGAQVVIERIRKAVETEEFQATGGRVFNITCSFGIAFMNPEGDSVVELFKRADEALYRAKNSGRNSAMISRSRIDPSA